MMVQPDDIFYQYLTEKDIPNLVEEHFLKGRPVESMMYVPAGEETPIPKIRDIPFFKDQRLIALRNRGLIDPDNIDEYMAEMQFLLGELNALKAALGDEWCDRLENYMKEKIL